MNQIFIVSFFYRVLTSTRVSPQLWTFKFQVERCLIVLESFNFSSYFIIVTSTDCTYINIEIIFQVSKALPFLYRWIILLIIFKNI